MADIAKAVPAEVSAVGVTTAKARGPRLAKGGRQGPAWAPQQRADFVVGVLGNHRTAELLGTSDS